MRSCALLFIFFQSLNNLPVLAQNQISFNDGPYVFYRKDSIIIKSLIRLNGQVSVDRKSYHISEKASVTLPIVFSENKIYNFSVKLKPAIVNEPCEFTKPDKIIALSDVEGEFEGFVELMIANKVINSNYEWTFGKGHLIICGDLFDRGYFVTETLWLLYKLEQGAVANGGYVHTILGNHDIMNMSNDVRYVQPKYFANAALLGNAYIDLYSENTELGRWLRSKNIIEKVGDFLCLHGGIAPELNKLSMSLQEINDNCRPYYSKSDDSYVQNDRKLNLFFSGETSPFWYRGYFTKPLAPQRQIDATLAKFGVTTILVGHTMTRNNIARYYRDKLIGLDVDQHNYRYEGAIWENDRWNLINVTGRKLLMPSF